MQEFAQDNLELISSILNSDKEIINNKHLENFIRQLFKHSRKAELKNIGCEILANTSKSFYNLVNSNLNEKYLINIYNPEIGQAQIDYTVLEVITENKPFILDSIICELNRRNFQVYNSLHTVIKVSRSDNGQLLQVCEPSKPEKCVKQESIVQLFITKIEEQEEINKLKNSLEAILEYVMIAVTDWHDMVSKSSDMTEFFSENEEESKNFLKWLMQNNYIFLGYLKTDENNKFTDDTLGIAKLETTLVKSIKSDLKELSTNDKIEIFKLNAVAPIHRNVALDCVTITCFDKNNPNKVKQRHHFIGLFTSAVYYQSATLIPIVKEKIDYVIAESGYGEISHHRKELVSIIESFPRDELLHVSKELLLKASIETYHIQEQPKVKLFVRKHKIGKFYSCMIFIPKNKFSAVLAEKIANLIELDLGVKITNSILLLNESKIARINYIVSLESDKDVKEMAKILENKIADMTSQWEERVHSLLKDKLGSAKADQLNNSYLNNIPETYKQMFLASPTSSFNDILLLEEAFKTNKVLFNCYNSSKDNDLIRIKIYSPNHTLTISELIPVLHNLGFNIRDSYAFKIEKHNSKDFAGIYYFRAEKKTEIFDESIRNNIAHAFRQIWDKLVQDDILNKLVQFTSLNVKQVVLLRAYTKYLKQINFSYNEEFNMSVLVHYPHLASSLVEYFLAKFSPALEDSVRKSRIVEIENQIAKDISQVSSTSEDKVLNMYLSLIKSTLRTNFFVTNETNEEKDYISFKFDSKQIPDIASPIPFKEIFVYSSYFEAIHLRGGKVARGGLRWSDRPEDFRTEVLGLMKAQMAKNSIIVPVGSKGGFVVKSDISGLSREGQMEVVVKCYKNFLRGLLDLTDNVVNNQIIEPKNVVCHDEEDPYLVVAADKGTATFSDIANGISEEYNFWLSDAFASGGSAGYDHKKMGITAKGAWISVVRHFEEMGKNINKEEFTVVGIGDMSGDVFGNGMLLSDNIKLIAAFNHMHIFVDPNPDSKVSYKERERLFNLPRSTWMDYNADLLSKGAKIFERKSKNVTLTPEIMSVLGIKEEVLTPDNLIKHILRAEVDLLWNGGIGTYVKSKTEINEQVGDKTNDNLRVNGADLRCKIVGEGGNLGFTQKGRIEYASKGGKLNTDAIDNSAGVDCSDHEVNIKIALRKAMENNSLNLQDRNVLLKDMTEDVSKLVLRDNYLQTFAISVEESQSYAMLNLHQRLINSLEEEGILDSKLESLPQGQDFARLQVEEKGLTRPEIAVILSYSKLSLYNNLIKTGLADDNYHENDLLRYFPISMQRKYANEIKNHQLKKEIIVTYVVNSLVNRLGPTFCQMLIADTGFMACDIARAYIINRDAFSLRDIYDQIEKLGPDLPKEKKIEFYIEFKRLSQFCIIWLLNNIAHPLNISEAVNRFKTGIDYFYNNIEEVVSGNSKLIFSQRMEYYNQYGIDESLAKKLAMIPFLYSVLNIINVTERTNLSLKEAGEIYFDLGEKLHFDWLLNNARQMKAADYWKRLSLAAAIDDLYNLHRKLTIKAAKLSNEGSISSWYEANAKSMKRLDNLVNDLKLQEEINFAMLVVAIKRIESMLIG